MTPIKVSLRAESRSNTVSISIYIFTNMNRTYFVYILQCNDNTYYVGVTNDYAKRFEEHMLGKHQRSYTFSRRPVELAFVEVFYDIKQAISREKQIKKWSQAKKKALIENNYEDVKKFAACLNQTSHLNHKKELGLDSDRPDNNDSTKSNDESH